MNAILHWFTAPEWSQVIKALLHSLWQGALIAAVLVLLMRRVTNPHRRYRFSLLALVLIPISGIVTWAALTPSNPRFAAPRVQLASSEAAPVITPNENPSIRVILPTNHSLAPSRLPWTAWLAVFWVLGTATMLSRAGIKLAGAEKLRRSSQPLQNPHVTQLLEEARRAVGMVRRMRVAVTDRLMSPAVVGVVVPTLILPLSLVTALTPEQIRFILLHELAHIRRGDYLANLFQLFIEAVLFFNPAVWWISHQVRREREACCDAVAIQLSGASADYARTLVYVAEAILNPASTAAPAFGDEREASSLAERIQRLLVPDYRPSLRLTWRAMITAFLVGTLLLVLSAEGTRLAVAEIGKPAARANNEAAAARTKETRPDPILLDHDGHLNLPLSPLDPARHIIPGSVLLENPLALSEARLVSGPIGSISPSAYNAATIAHSETTDYSRSNPVKTEDSFTAELKDWPIELSQQWFFYKLDNDNSGSRIEKVQRGIDHRPANYTPANYKLTAKATPNAIQGINRNARDNQFVPETSSATKPAPVEISGLNEHSGVNFDADTRYLHVTNGAVAKLSDMTIRADSIEFDQQSGKLIATGNVRVERRGDTNQTTRIELNVHNNQPPSENRRAIQNKLNQIILDRLEFASQPLSNVVDSIRTQTRRLDPEARGVNIVINPNVASRDDGQTVDVGGLNITINPPLTNVRLMDALNAILKVAGKPLKFYIDEYAVVISVIGKDEPMPLFMREYKVKPTIFTNWLAENGFPIESSATNPTHVAQLTLGLLAKAGINLEPTKGKSIYYSDKKGNLLIRATMEELDRTETFLQELLSQSARSDTSPPPASSGLSLRTFKVDPNTFWKGLESSANAPVTRTNVSKTVRDFFATLGVDLNPPKTLLFNERAGELLVRSTKEDLDIIEAALVVLNKEAAQVNIKVRFVEIDDRSEAGDLLLGSIPTNAVTVGKQSGNASIKVGSADAVAGSLPMQFTGILTDPQYRVVLRALEQRKGAELLAIGEVTTLSGQQAQIQAVELRTVVNGLGLPATSLPGNTPTNASTNSFYQTLLMPFGPVLDVLPTVLVDGLTIQMTVNPTVTEFLGYDDPGPSSRKAANKDAVLPLPRMRVRQMTTNAKIWDGQTLVLGMANDQLITKDSKGGFLKQEYTATRKKQLIVFITPTIIDQAGNRAHADVEILPDRPQPARR